MASHMALAVPLMPSHVAPHHSESAVTTSVMTWLTASM